MKDLDAGLLLDPFTFLTHWHHFPTKLEPEHRWEPLDQVLCRWLALWDRGKYYWDDELQYPLVRPWVEQDLVEALAAWDGLLSSIVKRLPTETLVEWQAPLSKALLDQFKDRVSLFTMEFLSRAKRPASFQLIAPGITIFSEESLVDTYAQEADNTWRRRWMEHADPNEWPSLLLPRLTGRPMPREHTTDALFYKDWGVGKFTVNREGRMEVGERGVDTKAEWFETQDASGDVTLDWAHFNQH